MVAHEAPVYAGLGAEIAARVTEQCFYHLEAPVLRVGGFATPYPPSRLEDHYLPDLDRILDAVDRIAGVLMTELKEFRLPDVGEGLTEADIVAWHVKPGDAVETNQIIVEIETAKAVVELPSPWDGTVARLLAEEGQTVDVGTPIITVDVGGDKGDGAERSVVPAAADADAAPPERQAVLVGYGVKASATTRRARKTAPAVAARAARTAGNAPRCRPWTRSRPSRCRSPDEHPRGYGAGAGQAAGAQAGQGPGHQPGGPGGHRARRLDHPGRRAAGGRWNRGPFGRKIWANGRPAWSRCPAGSARAARSASRSAGCASTWPRPWSSSAFTAPHVTEFLQVDVTETMAAVRRVRDLPEYADVRVSPLLFVARALLVAVARQPGDQRVLGRGGAGDRGQAPGQPGHRRGLRPRA